MNIIKNMSVLILFFGILIMTAYITKSYGTEIDDKFRERKRLSLNDLYQDYKSGRPSLRFDKMFQNPSVWMGYTDQNAQNFNDKDYYSGNQLGLKALLEEQKDNKGDTYVAENEAEYGVKPSQNSGENSLVSGSGNFNTDLYTNIEDLIKFYENSDFE